MHRGSSPPRTAVELGEPRRAQAHDLRGTLGQLENAERDGGAGDLGAHLRGPPGEGACLHDESIWCDDTSDGGRAMAAWRREAGLRVQSARKSNMQRLSYEWSAGLREICIDPERAPLVV